MKVKVGDKIFDGAKGPVMVILSKDERQQIADMHPDNTKYCIYPDIEEWTKDDYAKIKEWMRVPEIK